MLLGIVGIECVAKKHMKTTTIVIGYQPIQDRSSLKPAAIREQDYFDDLFSRHYLGEVSFANFDSYKAIVDEINPIIALVFSTSTAEEFRKYKKDCFIYVIDTLQQVNRGKKHQEQDEKFLEIEELIKKIESTGYEKAARAYAGMTYKETYEMIKDMLTSKDSEMVKKAMELIHLNHGDWPWIRVNLITDCWKYSDAIGKEKFLTINMEKHINSGYVKKVEDFVDVDGTICYQFLYADGRMYKVPVASKAMDKYAYEDLVNKYNKDFNTITVSLDKNKDNEL